jgi:hypothetical protein
VLVVTIRQSATPARLMGRMNASYRFLVWGGIAAGSLLGGVMGGSLGLRPTLAVSVVGMAAAPAWIVLSPIGRLRAADDAATETGGTTALESMPEPLASA